MYHLNQIVPVPPRYSFADFAFTLLDKPTYRYGNRFNIEESENSYDLTLELPGCKQSHLEVSILEDTLTVTVKRDDSEYRSNVLIPHDVDAEKTEAKLEDGIVRVTLKKTPKIKPLKIEIK